MGEFYSIVPHTADLQIHVEGKTLKELFKNALIGMFQSIKPEAPGCEYHNHLFVCPSLPQLRTVKVSSPDKEALLVDFLSEALYLSDLNNEAYLDVVIHMFDEKNIHADLYGVRIESFENEIKAVTYHDLVIQNKNGIWRADILFDI